MLYLKTKPGKDTKTGRNGRKHPPKFRDTGKLPLEQQVICKHRGVPLDPSQGSLACKCTKKSHGDQGPQTRRQGAPLSHSSFTGDPGLGVLASRPVPDVVMQIHDDGELRLRNAGRPQLLFKNAPVDSVERLARVNRERRPPLTICRSSACVTAFS